jgi:malonyl-CoA/methylmalonyl-CoA synthetase
MSLFSRAEQFGTRVALIADDATLTYESLLERSAAMAAHLLGLRDSLHGERIAFLVVPSAAHVVVQWGIWRAGGIAVPLCVQHPAPELAHVIEDSGATCIVVDAALRSVIEPVAIARNIPLLEAATLFALPPIQRALPTIDAHHDALIIYTSGTTGKPKGALSTHGILEAQIESVVDAWAWTERDHILHALPLHHLHGILNALCSALYAGAACELLPRFDANTVWKRIAAADGLTLFMGVPTMYAKLVEAWQRADEDQRARIANGCKQLRLMTSGSAALPVSVLEQIHDITGHVLLERYGMTELGMVLGNPLHGTRHAGTVGVPFPRVEVRLVDDDHAPVAESQPGQIEVRGPNVFKGYWNRADATREALTSDGWFMTGDTAVREQGVYRMLGRTSVDILKTGGYKVSALEIEEVLREHPAIAECCVVGIADETWGQRVAVAVILKPEATLALEALRAWSKERMAPYKTPTLLKVVAELPRNAMGKVLKPAVSALFEAAP